MPNDPSFLHAVRGATEVNNKQLRSNKYLHQYTTLAFKISFSSLIISKSSSPKSLQFSQKVSNSAFGTSGVGTGIAQIFSRNRLCCVQRQWVLLVKVDGDELRRRRTYALPILVHALIDDFLVEFPLLARVVVWWSVSVEIVLSFWMM